MQQHLGEMVRSTVEQTLNAMLDAEADPLCNDRRYEHMEAWTDHRARHCTRKLQRKAGEVRSISVLVAAGIGMDGFRDILGVGKAPGRIRKTGGSL